MRRKPLVTYFDVQILNDLKKLNQLSKVPMSAIVREAVLAFLEKQKKKGVL